MDLAAIREFCIQHGIPAEELDQLEETPVIRDIGEGLTLSLVNDDALGEMIVILMMRVDELEQRLLATQEGGVS